MTEQNFSDKPQNLVEMISCQEGSVVSRILLKSKVGNVTLFAFDAHQEISEHTTPFDAMVQVLEGTLKIQIGGVEHLVSAGEMLIMPKNIPHALHAEAPAKMQLTMLKEK